MRGAMLAVVEGMGPCVDLLDHLTRAVVVQGVCGARDFFGSRVRHRRAEHLGPFSTDDRIAVAAQDKGGLPDQPCALQHRVPHTHRERLQCPRCSEVEVLESLHRH